MTENPFAFISYCDKAFIVERLTEAREAGLLRFWCLIEHQPDEDDKKVHLHCWAYPAHRIDSVKLVDSFKQFDPKNPTKPRACLSPGFSKFGDFYYYNLHDTKYLALKGKTRNLHYTHEDFVSSNPDEFEYRVREIDLSEVFRKSLANDLARGVLPLEEAIARGQVPPHQVYSVIKGMRELWMLKPKFHDEFCKNEKIRRLSSVEVVGGILGNIDPESGEILPSDKEILQ